mgnify:CR=1 FL=1
MIEMPTHALVVLSVFITLFLVCEGNGKFASPKYVKQPCTLLVHFVKFLARVCMVFSCEIITIQSMLHYAPTGFTFLGLIDVHITPVPSENELPDSFSYYQLTSEHIRLRVKGDPSDGAIHNCTISRNVPLQNEQQAMSEKVTGNDCIKNNGKYSPKRKYEALSEIKLVPGALIVNLKLGFQFWARD